MSTVSNVSAAKPQTGGAIYIAPFGTTAPTDATTALSSTFKSLGYVSEDGLVNATEMEVESIKAWGGDTVLITQTSKEDTFSFTLIEILNEDVLKLIYGAANVSGTLTNGFTVKANSKDLDDWVLVIDMILRGGVLKRIVIPQCKVTEVGEINYIDNDAVGYETTVTCQPDAQENTHYEYIQAGSSGATGTT